MDREEYYNLLREAVLYSELDADMKLELDDFITELEESEDL